MILTYIGFKAMPVFVKYLKPQEFYKNKANFICLFTKCLQHNLDYVVDTFLLPLKEGVAEQFTTKVVVEIERKKYGISGHKWI